MTPRRSQSVELIDSHEHSEVDFRRSFRDIRRINRFLGGTSVVLKELARCTKPGERVSILDLGTGSADIPLSILSWARRRRIDVQIIGVDSNSKVLRYAATETAGAKEVRLVLADAELLPFPARSFDIVISSLTFHHFSDPIALSVLGEAARAARRAVIVNDLQRAYLPAALIWLVTRLTFMHRLTRNDAPLSVLRSRTLLEFAQLGSVLGLGRSEVRSHPFWRAALVIRLDRL